MEEIPTVCDLPALLRREEWLGELVSRVPDVVPSVIPASVYIQGPSGYSFDFTGVQNVDKLFGSSFGDFIGRTIEGVNSTGAPTDPSSTTPALILIPIPYNPSADVRLNEGTKITMGQVWRYQDEALMGLIFVIIVVLLIVSRRRIRPGILAMIFLPIFVLIVMLVLYTFGFQRRIPLDKAFAMNLKGSITVQLACDRERQQFSAQDSELILSDDFGISIRFEPTSTDLKALVSLVDSMLRQAVLQLGTDMIRSQIVPLLNQVMSVWSAGVERM